MIDALKFVQGAVAKRDFIPEMKHFVIEDGHVRAYNGMMALSSPIDFNINCKPKAEPLVRAIASCEDVAALGMTAGGRLRIQSGGFKAFIDCIDGEVPRSLPEGQEVRLDGEALLQAMKVLSRFVGNDAARPWTNGILLRGQSAFATNNVCLAEYWLGVELPFVVNIPMKAIDEVLRVGQPPTHAQLSTHSITFHYTDGRWIKTQLFETNWPDLSKILDVASNPAPVPEGLFEGLRTIKPFADKVPYVHFSGDEVSTHQDVQLGASYKVEGLAGAGVYHIKMLALLEDVATAVDFSRYPQPITFFGDRLRGAMLGVVL